jgi:stress response protein YsnF
MSGKEPSSDILRLYAEEASITRETVETGRLHVGKHTRTRDELVETDLLREAVEITTVPVCMCGASVPPNTIGRPSPSTTKKRM